MPHNISLITTLAAVPGSGLMFGYRATRLKLRALVGYLTNGMAQHVLATFESQGKGH